MHETRDSRWLAAARTLAIACGLAIAIGIGAGAITGWSMGAYEDFIVENRERAREASGALKKYVWRRTYVFALPLGVGGFAALFGVRRWAHVDGYIALLPLAAGAGAGWLAAQLVGEAVASDWSRISGAPTVPAVLFVAIPALLLFKDS
ncbi:MAG: hypothetical protein ACF8QF_02935 [Phycisphaerales bacterium]